MRTIALVGCGKSKLSVPAPAKDLYTGTLFRMVRAYAERFCTGWGILSAKHGFLLPDEVIEPYDKTMAQLGDRDYRRAWQTRTNWELFYKLPWQIIYAEERKREMDGIRFTERLPIALTGIEFVFLAGEAYEPAVNGPRDYPTTYPLRGMGLGNRLQWFKRQLEETEAAQTRLF